MEDRPLMRAVYPQRAARGSGLRWPARGSGEPPIRHRPEQSAYGNAREECCFETSRRSTPVLRLHRLATIDTVPLTQAWPDVVRSCSESRVRLDRLTQPIH